MGITRKITIVELVERKNYLMHKNDYKSIFSGFTSVFLSVVASAIFVMLKLEYDVKELICLLLTSGVAMVILYMINLARYENMRNSNTYIENMK